MPLGLFPFYEWNFSSAILRTRQGPPAMSQTSETCIAEAYEPRKGLRVLSQVGASAVKRGKWKMHVWNGGLQLGKSPNWIVYHSVSSSQPCLMTPEGKACRVSFPIHGLGRFMVCPPCWMKHLSMMTNDVYDAKRIQDSDMQEWKRVRSRKHVLLKWHIPKKIQKPE